MDKNAFSCSIKSNGMKPLTLKLSHTLTEIDIVESLADVLLDVILFDRDDGNQVRATRNALQEFTVCMASSTKSL